MISSSTDPAQALRMPSATSGGPAPLVYRVRGPRAIDELVELQSAKCTIGASRNATLRLRARHVAPVHCTVLRGSQATVVRAWAPDTQLNGRPFDSAPLTVGDRLRCGPIELELVERAPASDAGEPENRDAGPDRAGADRRGVRRHLRSRTSALVKSLRQLRRESQQWRAAAEERDVLGRQLSELQAAAAERDAAEQHQFEANRRELEARAEQLEDLAGRLSQERETLAAEKESIRIAQEEFARSRSRYETEQASIRTELLQRERELAGRLEALQGSQAELAERQAGLSRLREELEARQAKAQELAADAEATAEEAAASAARRQALDARQAELDDERRDWERQRGELQAELAAKGRLAEEQVAALDGERKALEEQRRQLELASERLAEKQREFATHELELARQREQLELARADIERQEAGIAAERERLEAERARQREAAPAERQTEGDDYWESSGPNMRTAAEQAPLGLDRHESALGPNDAFSRLRALSLLKETAENELHGSANQGNFEAAGQAAAAGPQPTAPGAAGGSEADEEEESIEAYMNRLLQRSRDGSSRMAPRTTTPSVAPRNPQPAAPVPAAPEATAPAERRKPVVRRAAPEKSVDILAMRELANFSAQSALDRYSYRRWVHTALIKAGVAVLGLATAIALLVCLPGRTVVQHGGAAIALVIALIWAVQSGLMLRQILATHRRRKLWLVSKPQKAQAGEGDHGPAEDHGTARHRSE